MEVPAEEAVEVQEEVAEVLEGILTVLALEALEVIILVVQVITAVWVVVEVLEGHTITVIIRMEVIMVQVIDIQEIHSMEADIITHTGKYHL